MWRCIRIVVSLGHGSSVQCVATLDVYHLAVVQGKELLGDEAAPIDLS